VDLSFFLLSGRVNNRHLKTILEGDTMSHMVKGKTSFTEENKPLLVEALKQAYKGKEIQLNAQAMITGRPLCDIVVKNGMGNDVGFRLKADGTYECLTYDPGYGNSQSRINDVLKPVYDPYNRAVAKKMTKTNPALAGWIVGKTADITVKGKKKKRIRISSGAGGSGSWI
jgi:hypothetical protein